MFFENEAKMNEAKQEIKEQVEAVKDMFKHIEYALDDVPSGKYDGETGTYYDCWEDDGFDNDMQNAELDFGFARSEAEDFIAGKLDEVTEEEYSEIIKKLDKICELLDSAYDAIPSPPDYDDIDD